MHVLVTGGAGYVGSVIVSKLVEEGFSVIVVDNLIQGHREAVHPKATFVEADICNNQALESIFKRYNIDSVMHMAAETVVSFSITDPHKYFLTNVTGSLNILDVMLRHGVRKIVFSSSAAVYGEPENTPITEKHRANPMNSYGESKLFIERILSRYYHAYNLKSVCLRYFCAAGATELLGEQHNPETHLIPNVIMAIHGNKPVSVYGNDYPTADGTCIRDFVHVSDIANAHIRTLEKLDDIGFNCYNLGSESGYSVMEVIRTAEKVTGKPAQVIYCSRRNGDPVSLIAKSGKAYQDLAWKPQKPDLGTILQDAWQWHVAHPRGYEV